MKKKYKIILFVLSLLAVTCYIISEPYGKNPFKSQLHYFANSEMQIESDITNYSKSVLKLKADSIVNNSILLSDFIGVTTGVYKKGTARYLGQAGLKDKSKLLQADKNTKHRIASISKSITAVAIMKLVSEGLLELNAPIQKYIPNFPQNPDGDITIHHLLSHTSGIAHYRSNWDGMSFTKYNDQEKALEAFQNRPFTFTPGTDYEYTTFGYTLLGAIIEKVTNQSLDTFLKENIFNPAGMKNTELEDGSKAYENKAKLYIKLKNNFIKSPKTELSIKYAGGGIQSTAEDLLKFGEAILNYSLIDSTMLDLMITNNNNLKDGTPYGYGWFLIDGKEEGRILQHGGSQSGASSFLQIYLDQQLVVATIANNFNSDNEVYLLSKDLRNLFQSGPTNKQVNYFKPISDKTLNNLTGTYTLGKEVLNITKSGDFLKVDHAPYPSSLVYPSSKNTFFYRYFDGKLVFDDEGLIYYFKGSPNRYKRK